MGNIWQDIEITGIRKSKLIQALFDSGAYYNYIRSENIYDGETPDDIGYHVFEGTKESILADGRTAPVDLIRFKEVDIEGRKVKEPRFFIMKNLSWDAIIGVDLMQKLGIILDMNSDTIIFGKEKI